MFVLSLQRWLWAIASMRGDEQPPSQAWRVPSCGPFARRSAARKVRLQGDLDSVHPRVVTSAGAIWPAGIPVWRASCTSRAGIEYFSLGISWQTTMDGIREMAGVSQVQSHQPNCLSSLVDSVVRSHILRRENTECLPPDDYVFDPFQVGQILQEARMHRPSRAVNDANRIPAPLSRTFSTCVPTRS